MAKRRRGHVSSRRRPRPPRRGPTKLNKAKAIVSAMTRGGAQRSATVHAAVRRAGISTRTYRTARKQLRTRAMRLSNKGGRRGHGKWYAKAP